MSEDYSDFKSRSRKMQLPADPGKTFYVGASNIKEATEQLERTPLGTPPANCDVRSVYDSRPLNAYDGNVVTSDAVVAEVGDPFDCEFTVREGYVFVVRELHHWFEPADIDWSDRSDVLMTLFLNGSALPDLEVIPVGVESDSLVKTFIVADELNTLRCRLRTSSAPTNNTTGYVVWYGNYLLKTGVPANQQIANCMGMGPIVPIPERSIQRQISPPPPSAPTPRLPLPSNLPPFTVVWHKIVIAGGKQRWEPLVTSGPGLTHRWKGYKGSARDLTVGEIAQYRNFINAARPSGVPAL